MATPFTSSQLERFRREAKKLSRTSTLTHSEALDCIAVQRGYKNWSLLAKHSASAHPASLGPPRVCTPTSAAQSQATPAPVAEPHRLIGSAAALTAAPPPQIGDAFVAVWEEAVAFAREIEAARKSAFGIGAVVQTARQEARMVGASIDRSLIGSVAALTAARLPQIGDVFAVAREKAVDFSREVDAARKSALESGAAVEAAQREARRLRAVVDQSLIGTVVARLAPSTRFTSVAL